MNAIGYLLGQFRLWSKGTPKTRRKGITVMRKIGPIAVTLLISALVLAGCAAEPGPDGGTQPGTSSSTSPETETEATTEPEAGPPTQEETCGWDASRLESGTATAPRDQNGDVGTALIGAWQHTHIDEGSGYEAVKPTTDIRYVFPSTTRMLYCQDVKGATNQAENAVDMTLDGLEIVLQPSGVSYGVVAWDANTMVWKNHRDGSLYLLKRR